MCIPFIAAGLVREVLVKPGDLTIIPPRPAPCGLARDERALPGAAIRLPPQRPGDTVAAPTP